MSEFLFVSVAPCTQCCLVPTNNLFSTRSHIFSTIYLAWKHWNAVKAICHRRHARGDSHLIISIIKVCRSAAVIISVPDVAVVYDKPDGEHLGRIQSDAKIFDDCKRVGHARNYGTDLMTWSKSTFKYFKMGFGVTSKLISLMTSFYRTPNMYSMSWLSEF